MPTVKRTITESIQRKTEARVSHFCCDEMSTTMAKDDYGPKCYSGSLTIGGRKINHCPYCGEKIIYDDTVTLPDGYERKIR